MDLTEPRPVPPGAFCRECSAEVAEVVIEPTGLTNSPVTHVSVTRPCGHSAGFEFRLAGHHP